MGLMYWQELYGCPKRLKEEMEKLERKMQIVKFLIKKVLSDDNLTEKEEKWLNDLENGGIGDEN